jgi:hypothetical protein
MMSALAAQASAPPSPVRPIAVISTKSDTKLAELSSISSIRGMFDSEARYRDFFNVEDEHGTPVTNIVSAIDALRDTIKLQCLIDPPDLTDAQLKSMLFLHFDKGKSGLTITDLRPKSMSKVSTPADLIRILSIASRLYSSVYGLHLQRGFQQLQADLSELLHHLPGSITTPSAIQLVDGALAALRLAFRGFGDLEEIPDANFLAQTASTAMSIPLDHPTVLAFERISYQKSLISQKSSDPSDKPRGDRAAAPTVVPKSAAVSSGAAGGAGPAKDKNARPVINGKYPCFSWASKSGACGALAAGSTCTHHLGPFPHAWDNATTPKDKSTFLGWLLKNKE